MSEYPTCEDQVDARLESSLEDLRLLWRAHAKDRGVEDLGYFHEYGLDFSYVEPYTWRDQPKGYWRYQLSWGGPSDEFRFFDQGHDGARVEYWFLDWSDGAHRILAGDDRTLMLEIYDFFREVTAA